MIHYGKLHIYEIENALPRVYAARGIPVIPDGIDWPSFFAVLEQLGPGRVAVVRVGEAASISGRATTANVEHFDLVVDGFDVRVNLPTAA